MTAKKKTVKKKAAGASVKPATKAPAPTVAAAKFGPIHDDEARAKLKQTQKNEMDELSEYVGERIAVLPNTHITTFEAQIHCPSCKTVLAQTFQRGNKKFYICNNQRCAKFEAKYKMPEIELEMIPKDD